MTNDNNAGATSSCCSTSTGTPNPAATDTGHKNLLSTSEDEMTTCPVMAGSPVNKKVAEAAGLYRDYEGNRYWFCCAGCGPAFDSAPAKYAAAMA